MIKKTIHLSKRRGRVIVRYGRPPEARARGAAGEGVRVQIEDLPAYLAHWGLRVVGGDPDLDGDPWRPVVYVVEV